MKNILFFTSKIENSGGTEKTSIILANQLIKYGYNVFFFNLIGGDKPFFYVDNNVSIFSMRLAPNSTRRNIFGIIIELRKFIQSKKIDTVVNVDSILMMFSFFSLYNLSVRNICWEHFNYNIDLGVFFRRFGRRLAAYKSDYIVVLTNRDKQLWLNSLKKVNSQLITIPNPMPANQNFSPRYKNKTVLSIGRPAYVKGYDMLLDAWAIVKRNEANWVLKIVGLSEQDIMSLRQQAEKLGINDSVLLLPATNDIKYHYENASLYCMTSRFEGLPMVLLEAQSYNLPIVSFDCDTGPAEIIQNYKNGILVNQNSINQLAAVLLKIFNDEVYYEQMVKNCSMIKTKFSLDKIVNQWLAIL